MILRGLTGQMGCPKCGEKFRPNAAELHSYVKRGCGVVKDKQRKQVVKLELLNLQSHRGPLNLRSAFVQLYPF
jgi:hypothetical protein